MKMLEFGGKHRELLCSFIDIQSKHVLLLQGVVQFSCTSGSNCQTHLCTVAFAESLVELRRKTFQMWKTSQVDTKGLHYGVFCK